MGPGVTRLSKASILTMLLALAGCGAETAGTAAMVAAQKQREIEQGRQIQEDVQQQLDAAALAAKERMEAAETAAAK